VADKALKAVIWAEFDPRGVTKGVAAANTELAKLNKTAGRTATAASISAALNVAQMGMDMLRTVVSAVDKRFTELDAVTRKYSATAAGAAAQAKATEVAANVRIANALTPGSLQAIQAEQAAKRGEASRIERNAQQVSQGMGATARTKANYGTQLNILTEGAGTGIFGLEQMLGGDVKGGFGTIVDALKTTAGELINPNNYAYQQQSAPGRGMQTEDQRQTEYLRQIAKSVGGGQ